MTKAAAPREPSMDEILSSIRQIIADDDAAMPRRAAAPQPAGVVRPAFVPPPVARKPEPEPEPEPEDEDEDDAPLALSPEQIVAVPPTAARPSLQPQPMVIPDDVAFAEPEPEPEPAPSPAPVPAAAPVAAPRRPVTVEQAAPLPDPTLTADMAERLLEDTTNAAVRRNFAKLNHVSVGQSVSLEAMMREMLRPLLKDWLDEHLPAVVERMVEKEIARISRGVDL
jgi:cell pole-organizing protein PopZ